MVFRFHFGFGIMYPPAIWFPKAFRSKWHGTVPRARKDLPGLLRHAAPTTMFYGFLLYHANMREERPALPFACFCESKHETDKEARALPPESAPFNSPENSFFFPSCIMERDMI